MKRVARVVLAGAFAGEFLASPGEARAIGVFRRSMYLENARGRIACLAGAGVGPGPLNALCEFPGDADFRKKAAPESRVMVGDGLVRLEPGLIVDVSRPAEWEPPPLPDGWNRGRLRRNLALLAGWTGKRGAREGLAPLVPRIAAGGKFAPASVFEEMAREGADALGDWLSDALNGEEAPPAFSFVDHPLIGLGPGLTPSGDDFWCGAMIALRALGRLDVLEKVAGGVLSRAAERTNRISRAHLACAAAGQGAGALHEAISALGTADEARLRSALRALERVGGASGRDSLAGVACVFARAAGPRRPAALPRELPGG